MKRRKSKLKTLLFTNIAALTGMYFANNYIYKSAIRKNILKPGMGSVFHWKEGDVYYKTYGTGTPIVLIHDLDPMSSSCEWNEVIKELSKNHRVFIVDLPGCGRSDKPNLIYTCYFYVQFLTAFLEEVVKEEAYIAATSLSGSFAVMTAYSAPSLVRQIILVNPSSLNCLKQQPTKKSVHLRKLVSIPIIGTSIYNIKYALQNVEYAFTEKYFFNPFKIRQKYIDAYYEAAHFSQCSGKHLLASLDGNFVYSSIDHALTKMETPVTILYGNKVKGMNTVANSYQKLNHSIETVSLTDTAFLPQLENPGYFTSELLKHLI